MSSALLPIADSCRTSLEVRLVPQADYPLATSDVLVKAALDIGATWSERRCRRAVGNAAIDAWKKPGRFPLITKHSSVGQLPSRLGHRAQILRAVGAPTRKSCGGRYRQTINSPVTSVVGLRTYRSAICARLVIQREIGRVPSKDFCNTICHKRTHTKLCTQSRLAKIRLELPNLRRYEIYRARAAPA
jgi:hypothetical protein